jgi:hypothetical protein
MLIDGEIERVQDLDSVLESVAPKVAVGVPVTSDTVTLLLNEADGVATLWLIVKLWDAVSGEPVLVVVLDLLREWVITAVAVILDGDELCECDALSDGVWPVPVTRRSTVSVAIFRGVSDRVMALTVCLVLCDSERVRAVLLVVKL